MTVSHDPLGTAVYFYFPTGNILSDRNHPLVATIQNLPFFYKLSACTYWGGEGRHAQVLYRPLPIAEGSAPLQPSPKRSAY